MKSLLNLVKLIAGIGCLAIIGIVLLVFVGIGKAGTKMAERGKEEAAYVYKLEVQPGWTYTKDGDYSHIRGRVKNIGDKVVRYWKITSKYYNPKGEMLDQGYTNSGEDLLPGEADSFEIMHRDQRGSSTAYLDVTEALLK